MSDLSILIRAILEKSSKVQIEQELKSIEDKLKPLEIKIDKKALDVLQSLVEVNKKISSGIEQANSKLNEQTKYVKNEQTEVNKLTNAYDELGKKIKTVQNYDAYKTPTSRTETYKDLAGKETIIRIGKNEETNYSVITKDKTLQQEQLEFEKHIGDIQSKNFNEAKQHLTQIRKLRQDYYKLGNKDTEEAKELTKQMTYHQGQYNNIIRRKIDIGEQTKIEGIETQKLNQLEKFREQTLRNISNIKARNNDKEIIQQNKITDEIRKQSLAQQDLLNKIRGMRGIDGKFIVGDNLNALNQLETQITGFDPTNKNFSKNMDEANSKLKQISTTTSIYKKEVQDANKYTGIFGQSIFEAGKKFASWLLIGNVIMGVAGAVRNGIQYITDIDTALTNLNKVTDETKETLKDFSIEANSIGRELAKTTMDVINSTTEFARLGFSLQQATQLAKQALLYSNVGDIGVEEASLAIISAVKGFGVEVDSTGRNVQKIVDIYNEVGNNFAISSAGIGEAMRRSSASLYAAGNTMEEAVALITAANSVVQDPAAVGTALKTISMRLRGVSEDGEDVLEYLPKLEQSFKNVGIQIRKDENTFKSTYQLMTDLASVWGTLTDVQRAHMSELVAGKRQGNIVMAMMSNYTDMQDSLNSALNSTNSALIENEKYMNSIQAKQEIFKNTAIGKWQEALDSNVIKGFVVAMTNLVEVLGNLNTVIMLSTTAFLLWKGTALTNGIIALTSFIATESMATVSTTALTGSVGGLTKAFNALKVAIATNPIGLLAVAITSAIIAFNAYTNHVKKAREENEKFIEKTQSQIETLKQQKSGLKELSSEYETLKEKEKNLTATVEEKKRLLEVQKELVDNYGVSATGINLEGEAYTNSTEAIKLRTLALEKEIEKEKERLELSVLSADALNTRDIKTSTTKKDEAETKIEKINKVLPYFEENDPYTAELYKKQLKELNKDIEDANNVIQNASKNRQKLLEYDAQETIKSIESNGKEMSDSAKLVVSEFAKSLALKPEDLETQQQSLKDFIDKVSSSDLDPLIEKYNTFVSAINAGDKSKENVDGLEQTSTSIDNLITSLTEADPNLKEFAIDFTSLYPPTINAKNAIDLLNDSLKEIDFDSITDEVQFLHKALQELSSSDGLSSSSQEKILSEYPKLFAYMDDEIELRKQLQTILEESEEQQINAFLNVKDANGKTRKEMLETDESYFNNVIKDNEDFLKIVNEAGVKSIKDFKTIADAKEAIESATIKRMSQLWTKYYGATDPTQDKELYKHMSSMAMFGSSDDPRTQLAKDTLSAISARDKAMKELNELINEDVSSKLSSINLGDIKSSSSSKDSYISDQYAIATAELEQKLKTLEYTKSKLSDTSEEYRHVLEEEIAVHKQIQDLALAEQERINAELASGKLSLQETDKAKKQILDLEATWMNTQKTINDTNFAIIESEIKQFTNTISILTEDLNILKSQQSVLTPISAEYAQVTQDITNKTIEYINALKQEEAMIRQKLASTSLTIAQQRELEATLRKVINTQKELQVDLMQQLNDLADQMIEAYKSVYEKQRDSALDALDAQIDAEEERHDQVMDNLDDEIRLYEDLINAKLKLLEQMDAERDYTKDLTKLQKERQEIQDKLNALSLDDSDWGMSQKEDLMKQLAEKDMSIEDLQYEYNLDLRKQNLQDLLDDYKSEVDAKKDAEDKKFKIIKDYLNRARKEQEKHFDELINDEERWASMRSKIVNTNLDQMKTSFDSFTSFLHSNMSSIGGSINANLILKMNSAIALLTAYNNASGGGTIGSTPMSGGHYDSSLGYYVGGTGQSDYDRTGQAIKYYSDNGMTDKLIEAIAYAGRMKYKYTTLHDGGIVGDVAPNKITDLVNKLFNLKPNEQIVKALKNELYIPQKNIPNLFNNLTTMIGGMQPAVAGGSVVNNYNLELKIGSVTGDKKGVDFIFKEINKGLNKIGK